MPTDAKLSISYRPDNKNQRLIGEYMPGGLLLIENIKPPAMLGRLEEDVSGVVT